jgi:4-alpha-glucanotransferase
MLRITFNTNYHTRWGEKIVVTGNILELGQGDLKNALDLSYKGNGNWSQTIDIAATALEYQYVLVNEKQQEILREWGKPRTLHHTDKDNSIALQDSWRGQYHPQNALHNAAFLKVIFNPKASKASKIKKAKFENIVRFKIQAPRLEKQEQLCVLGNIPALGGWNAEKPLLLGNENYPEWSGDGAMLAGMNIEYKYGIYDTKEKAIVCLEDGENRTIPYYQTKENGLTIIHDNYFAHPRGNWKGTGIALPVFALRSRNSLGVGEFTDIRLLIDWAAQVGMKMVQILPINDTSATATWVDSYPYAAISVFALHPMYLNIEAVDGFAKVMDAEKYRVLQNELNALEAVDYERVNASKLLFARQIFEATKDQFLNSKAFRQFFDASKNWLSPYAYFCTLRDAFGTPDFNQWEADAAYSVSRMEAACDENSPQFHQIAFYYFLQFHLDQQLQKISDYARKNSIILKGDIPIGIYRYSVDAWTQPHLYHMDAQAGAPPDPFSATGQNWGFPTYNWDVMEKDGFAWWQNRLKTLSKYFDAFRIDHILGFFRIWQVPYDSIHATLGYFNPAIPVTKQELYQRGVGFDYLRFCKPFITSELVGELFGTQAELVKSLFLEPLFEDEFQFKPEFDTQRKVENYFKNPNNRELLHLKPSLFQLLAEVLFIEVPNSQGQAFHPRFDLYKTYSFKQFSQDIQDRIYGVYLDYFYGRQEEFWAKSAMRKLPAIQAATDMLICGEDLGMIPNCVPQVMKDLDMLTLEIQRMSKNPQTDFLQAADTPYYSVCSPSTHDMSPLRLWWVESSKAYIQKFYTEELNKIGAAPLECTTEIAEQIIQQHLDLPSMWTVFPFADILAMDDQLKHPNPLAERINEPSNPQHYWRYRMHISMETLIEEKNFSDKLKEMITKAGR